MTGRLLVLQSLNYFTNHVVSHVPSFGLRRRWYQALGVEVDAGADVFMDCYLWFYGPRQIARTGARIGRDSVINRGCLLDVRGPLTIGDNVSISPGVAIITTQHDYRVPGFPLQTRPVVIEDNVWIGARATILPGSKIGRGAVVAAGSVVAGNVAPLSVVVGTPARVVGSRPLDALDYDLSGPVPLFE